MLESAVAAIESAAHSVPEAGETTLASTSQVISVAPPANSSPLDAAEFHNVVGGGMHLSNQHVISVTDSSATQGLQFHGENVPASGASQDISDRISSLSHQLQGSTVTSLQAQPNAAMPHDALSPQLRATVGELQSTYSTMITASFFSHVGSQLMQVFNTLLKGQ